MLSKKYRWCFFNLLLFYKEVPVEIVTGAFQLLLDAKYQERN